MSKMMGAEERIVKIVRIMFRYLKENMYNGKNKRY